ncbi:MAG: protein kinase [Verrucomicrobiae bacterium]|nr:protein kinase [Verrucomicrobiae bacterium]
MLLPALCPRCGSAPADGALEGQCPRCLGLLAFGAPLAPADEVLHRSGQYEILREIGRGGMGIVYEARQPQLNRRVAIKMLLAGAGARPDFKPRFRAEAEAAARLRHPGIVTIHEVGELDGQPFLAMELVEGPSLAELVRQHPLPPLRAARYVRLIADAIAHAHRAGILHRDLKPSNVLLDAQDQPRITDFGLAKQLDSDADLTRSGEIMGSPAYLPPEQLSGGTVAPSGDVYSLGAILYELLTAQPPFVADTVASTLQQVLHNEPVSPRLLNATVPRDLDTLCLKCLHKEPHRRYATAADLAADLARFEAGEPVQARPVSRAERGLLWSRRNPALAMVSAALAMALIVGSVSVLVQWRRAEASRGEMSRNLYAADVAAASTALHEGNLGRARDLLIRHPGPEGTDQREFTHRLLWARCQGDHLATFGQHPWIVTSVAVSPDGQWVASGSQDQPGNGAETLKLWSLSLPTTAPRVLSATNTVWTVAFSGDSRTLVSAGLNGVGFWDTTTGRARAELPAMAGEEATVAGSLVVSSPNHPFFRTITPEPLWRLDLTTGELQRLNIRGWHPSLSPDGRRLAVMDADQSIQLFDLATGRRLFTVATNLLNFHLRFSPDGHRLVSSGQTTVARVWNLEHPGSLPLLFPSSHNVWDAAFSPDGSTLITATSHQQLELWDVASGVRLGALAGHTNEVWSVAATPDGRHLISGGKDRTVRLWSAAVRPTPPSIPSWRHFKPGLSPDGTRLLAYNQTNWIGAATVWNLGPVPNGGQRPVSPSRVGILDGYPRGFAPDHSSVLFLRDQPPALEWRTPETGALVRTVALAGAPTNLFAGEFILSGNASALLCPDESGTFHRWSTTEGRKWGQWRDDELAGRIRTALSGPQRPSRLLRGLAASQTGRWLALGPFGTDGGYLVDLNQGASVRLRGHHDDIAALAFSWDDRLLATGSVDGTIRLWEVPDGRFVGELPGHLESVEAVAFAPDGQTLASVNPGIEITFWHLPTRRELARLAHPDIGDHLLFSADGRRLILGLTTGGVETVTDRIEIWDAP